MHALDYALLALLCGTLAVGSLSAVEVKPLSPPTPAVAAPEGR